MSHKKLKVGEPRQRRTLTLAIPVTENVPPAMYLRQVLGEGTYGKQPVEVAISMASIVVAVGKFPVCRQFVVSVADIGMACCEAMEKK